jgi:Family of unknown function (DUF6510)
MNANLSYLDGNAAAGELSRIFTVDLTAAEGQCANCGAKRRFADARLYVDCPGLVARCAMCDHVLLRLVNTAERTFLDLRGMAYLNFSTKQLALLQDPSL